MQRTHIVCRDTRSLIRRLRGAKGHRSFADTILFVYIYIWCDIVLFSKTSHRLTRTSCSSSSTVEIPQTSVFRQGVYIYFFPPQKPYVVVIIVVVVVVVDDGRPRFVGRRRQVAWPERETTYDEEDPVVHVDNNIYVHKCVGIQNNTIGRPPSRQTKSPDHLRGGPLPGPKTPEQRILHV